jgi:hypothetical protein
MSVLFESTEINGMTLSNRFVRSATWEGMAAEDGAFTPKLVDLVASPGDRWRWLDYQQPRLRAERRPGQSLAVGYL